MDSGISLGHDYAPAQYPEAAGWDPTSSYSCPLDLSYPSGDSHALGVQGQIPPVSLIHDEVIGPSTNDEFLRSALISPDGSNVLTISETNYLVVWDINEELLNNKRYFPASSSTQEVDSASRSLHPSIQLQVPISIGDAIYDVAWYPSMHRDVPGSACAAVALRDHPVQLWDTVTGEEPVLSLSRYTMLYFSETFYPSS
jgi:WD40 repeat protein